MVRAKKNIAVMCASLMFAIGATAFAGVAGLACGTSFDPDDKIEGVRILAVKADKPYAQPGDTVNLSMLVADGRSDQTTPLKVTWIPATCINPVEDLYYACFTSAASFTQADGGALTAGGAGSAGDDGGGSSGTSTTTSQGGGSNEVNEIISKIPPHTDLSTLFPQGTNYSFVIPPDIISSHKITPGAPEPYGLAILFNYACAGKLEVIPLDPNGGPQQIPLGCFDDNENPVTADNGVLGLMRVYAYETQTNANPVIESFQQDGNGIDPNAGITIPHCEGDCTATKLFTEVPDSSWEVNPDDKDENGNPQHEQIWVDYYTTLGSLDNDAVLLFDVSAGRLNNATVGFTPPNQPAEGTIWAVVHDNRGGVEWVVVPVHVQ
jgi:hypothetical protein